MMAFGNFVYNDFFPGKKLAGDIQSYCRFHHKREQNYINGVTIFSCLVSKPSSKGRALPIHSNPPAVLKLGETLDTGACLLRKRAFIQQSASTLSLTPQNQTM